MLRRLNEVPKYSQASCRVQAGDYNIIRLALRRLPEPIVLQLNKLPHINMIIDEDSWVCVDSSLNDLPIIAWTDFQTGRRSNLHEPIQCQLSYYHFQASALVTRALNTTRELLNERLAAPRRETSGPATRRRYRSGDRELFVIS